MVGNRDDFMWGFCNCFIDCEIVFIRVNLGYFFLCLLVD